MYLIFIFNGGMMGYFNIIDSLSDIKVNEGMVESIPKNKNKDIDNLVKALLTSDIDTLYLVKTLILISLFIIGQVLVRIL